MAEVKAGASNGCSQEDTPASRKARASPGASRGKKCEEPSECHSVAKNEELNDGEEEVQNEELGECALTGQFCAKQLLCN